MKGDKKLCLMLCIIGYYKDNDFNTFEEALEEALSGLERGFYDKFDIVKWDEDEGELYCIWEDGIITFKKN